MGTEVLRPKDSLGQRFQVGPPAFYHRENYSDNGNGFGSPKPNRKPVDITRPERPDRRKKPIREFQQVLTIQRRSSSFDVNRIEMGQATMLRRGQSWDSFDRENKYDVITAAGDDIYAGSAFSVSSPPPTSLPLPSFFINETGCNKLREYDDFASRDLRRLLGLQ